MTIKKAVAWAYVCAITLILIPLFVTFWIGHALCGIGEVIIRATDAAGEITGKWSGAYKVMGWATTYEDD